MREYESQHYLLKIMGIYLFHENVKVRAEYHAKSADNERAKRVDIIIEIGWTGSLTHVVIIELKFTTQNFDSTESNRKLGPHPRPQKYSHRMHSICINQ